MGGTYPSVEGSSLWRSVGKNLGGGTMDMSFFGICREAGASGLKFASRTRNYNPDKKASVKARCPDGYRVVGGGIESPDPLVMATIPYDANDVDLKPDDGWKASAVNNDDIKRELTAHATCRKAGGWDLAYRSEEGGVAGGSTVSGSQTCTQGDAVTGGGGAISGALGTVRVHETYPVDLGDVDDETPENAWTTGLTNTGVGLASGVVHAICRT